MKKIIERWWFWVIFATILIVLFVVAIMITKSQVDSKYENLTKFNKEMKENNENRQIRWNSLNI